MTFGIGEFYSIACAFCWAGAIIIFKASGDTFSANSLNLFKNFIGISLLIPTALIIEGFSLPDLSAMQWWQVAISGFIGIAISDTWYFLALRKVGASNTAIVASLYSPFVVVLSFFFLDERLAWLQLIGFSLVLSGIVLVTYHKKRHQVDSKTLWQGMSLAAGAVLLNAIGVVMIKRILEGDGFFWVVTLRLGGGVVGTLLVLMLTRKLVKSLREFKSPHNWPVIIAASVLATYISMMLWLGGYKYTDASVASVLNELSTVFIVLLAWIFLKEEVNKRKVLGVVLAFTGVVLFINVSG